MATPVGHYLLGLAVAQALARNEAERRRGLWLGLVACAPDLDVLPGLALGEIGRFHHGITHSLAVAALAGVTAFLAPRLLARGWPVYLSVVVFLVYGSHLLLDYFTLDTGAPYGIPLFWPFSQETYQAWWPLLPNVQHTSGPLLSAHNLMLMLREAAVLLPTVGLVLALKVHGRLWPRGTAWLLGASSFAAACISALTVR